MFTRAYHRVSDDSISTFGGHETFEEALADALGIIQSPDIDHVWIRDEFGNVIFKARITDEDYVSLPRRAGTE